MLVSLRNQILVPFCILIALAVASVTGTSAYWAGRQATRRIDEQLATLAATLGKTEFPLNNTILDHLKALSQADFVLTDELGRVQAGTLPGLERLPPQNDRLDSQSRQTSLREVLDTRYFHTEIVLRRSRAPPELLHILYPERIRSDALREAVVPPLALGTAVLLPAGVLSFLLAAKLGRPLRRLQEQVGAIAQGRFEKVQQEGGALEIQSLAASVNAMVEELTAQSHAIQRGERMSLMGQLSGGLAHQLRNGVTGARLALQLHDESCTAADRESTQVALRQMRLMEEQLQRFLTAGRRETPHMERCDLRKIVEEVQTLVSPMCRHRRLNVEFDCEPAVDFHVQGDPRQLSHLVSNLLINATEASATEGWMRIALVANDKDSVMLRVSDGGPGPPRELLPRLFEPFITGKPEGIGLGLAASRQIAAAHGGTLTFAGYEPTTFEFTMPRRGEGGHS